ncbi:hypothetical protein [Gordonibacter sp.]|uniref:hypothetical protein n=1 Tax=Gordonibacter sp. TaxID=1968902 RepID=UPI002FC7E0C3
MQNENKQQFVADFQHALISNGAGRYDDLVACPFGTEEVGDSLFLLIDNSAYGRRVDITCDSLTSIAREMCKYVG